MFTSLNVVRMALVDCDCSRRSAIRARRRLIGTRCSGRSPSSAESTGRGHLLQRPAWRSGRACTGAGLGGRCWAPRFDRAQHVALGDAAILAGAGQPEPAGQVACRPCSLAAAGMATPALLPTRRQRQPERRRRQRLPERRRQPERAAPAVRFGVDLGDEFIGRDGIAVVLDDLRQHAGGGRRHFEHDLVGLDLDQDFIDGQRLRPASSSSAAWSLRRPIRTVAEP